MRRTCRCHPWRINPELRWPGSNRGFTGISLSIALKLGLLLSQSSQAGLLLTEIHYNGPSSGLDPDEFIELTNTGTQPLNLAGYRFARGIGFSFAAGTTLEGLQSLVIARDPGDFTGAFPAFTGALFDYSGSLSNSGETLELLNDTLETLWSVSYDDAGAWPRSADGAGDSLQLLGPGLDLTAADSWVADTPTPGSWAGLPSSSTGADVPPAAAVPVPATGLLVALGLGLLRRRPCGGGKTAKAGPDPANSSPKSESDHSLWTAAFTSRA